MTATERTKLKNYDAEPTQTLEQQDEAEAAPVPLEITHRIHAHDSRAKVPRLPCSTSSSEKLRIAEHKLP